jgi:hypothetical protein
MVHAVLHDAPARVQPDVHEPVKPLKRVAFSLLGLVGPDFAKLRVNTVEAPGARS